MLTMMDVAIDTRLGTWDSLEQKRLLADRMTTAWSWKSRLRRSFPVIGCLMGGTGTGKSTIFNSLAGKQISEVSKRRPSTTRPMVLAPSSAVDELLTCPFLETGVASDASADKRHPTIDVLADFAHPDLVLVDTPDFDSAEIGHHVIANNFFLISDFIILVTSQEKYADFTAHEVSRKALEWDKTVMFVMNKVSSDAAYDDFCQNLSDRGFKGEPARIERLEPSPSIIPGLAERSGFGRLFAVADSESNREHIRSHEMRVLRQHTAQAVGSFIDAIDREEERIAHVNRRIAAIEEQVLSSMEERTHTVVSRETEVHIRDRLQELLRKYDILFVPRMLVRNTLWKAYSSVSGWLLGKPADESGFADEKKMRFEDLKEARSVARLEPLEAAIASLNMQTAQLLCSDSLTDDLCKIAQTDVPRWDPHTIRSLYDEAFPGVEKFLEREFQHLREGLSGTDELKLYGSYTLWAVFLIVVEITVLGGSAMLDALLGTVIMPFIPKWVLNVKVVDLLKDIGLRVEREHRQTLRDIIHRQAELYSGTFNGLLPAKESVHELREMRDRLRDSA